jgi:hypothetical protein
VLFSNCLKTTLSQDLANELSALSQIVQFYVEKNLQGNVPDVLMSSGLFRDFVQLFTRFKYQESLKACRVTLLILCNKHEKLCSFAMLVPEFIENIQEALFLKNFPAEACFWFLTFSVHSKLEADRQSYVEQAGTLTCPLLAYYVSVFCVCSAGISYK